MRLTRCSRLRTFKNSLNLWRALGAPAGYSVARSRGRAAAPDFWLRCRFPTGATLGQAGSGPCGRQIARERSKSWRTALDRPAAWRSRAAALLRWYSSRLSTIDQGGGQTSPVPRSALSSGNLTGRRVQSCGEDARVESGCTVGESVVGVFNELDTHLAALL